MIASGARAARANSVTAIVLSALFTWIKRHPAPKGRPLNGLVVLDEAQNFAPSQKGTPCKGTTIALAAQPRKYGLGMIFATQVPKGIDNKIIGNCTTQFYGKMNAPATIEATRELMANKGGAADDIGNLTRGLFYFSTEGIAQPVKIETPLACRTIRKIRSPKPRSSREPYPGEPRGQLTGNDSKWCWVPS